LSEGKIKDSNYVVIQGWMLNKLGLKGNELLIYAIIYGFTQSESQEFTGSLQYLADWTNSTKRSCISTIQSLVTKGYINKRDEIINGVKFCRYSAAISPVVKNFHWGGENFSLGGGEKNSPNNIDIDNIEDKQECIMRTTRKRFVVPTLEEVISYCRERNNNVDAERFIDYYTSNGWKVGKNPMKDWKAAVRTWERQGWVGYGYRGKPQNPNPSQQRPDAYSTQRLLDMLDENE
jgi:hypothetical protein